MHVFGKKKINLGVHFILNHQYLEILLVKKKKSRNPWGLYQFFFRWTLPIWLVGEWIKYVV
jgi:hypothetical protein